MEDRKKYEFLMNWLETCNLENNPNLSCVLFYDEQKHLVISMNNEEKIISDEKETWWTFFATLSNNEIIKPINTIDDKIIYHFKSQQDIDKVLVFAKEYLK